MLIRTFKGALLGACMGVAAIAAAAPASAQITVSPADDVAAGELAVPLNKSQVLRTDRPFAKALIGSPDIADVLPLSDSSLYVLGKKMGTTSLTLYDRSNRLIAVVDVAVGPGRHQPQASVVRPDGGQCRRPHLQRLDRSRRHRQFGSGRGSRRPAGRNLRARQGHQPDVDRLGPASHAGSALLGSPPRRIQGSWHQRLRIRRGR